MPPRHLLRVSHQPHPHRLLPEWISAIPAVAAMLELEWEVPDGVTVLVGENGSGKSTIVEALAQRYPRLPSDLVGPTTVGDESELAAHLRLHCHPMASRAGFFLRAEAMHGYLDARDRAAGVTEPAWSAAPTLASSHGEGFLWVLKTHFWQQGVYFLDEPEAALSFSGCLALLSLLNTMRAEGSQVILATHSPLIAALPGATVIELGDWGWRESPWQELEMVQRWRDFLEAPERFFRHLFDD